MSPAGKCLPGEGQCAKGEAPGKDGTCKQDKDGDGKGDEDGGDDGGKGEKKTKHLVVMIARHRPAVVAMPFNVYR